MEGKRINKKNASISDEVVNKRKKIAIISVFIIFLLLILFFPIKEVHDDGGSISYTSLTYKVMNWRQTFGRTDKEIYWFPNNLKDYEELNTTTYFNGFIVQKTDNEILLNNREFDEEIQMFRMPINPYFDKFDNKDELKISDELRIGMKDPVKGDDGVYTAKLIYGLDWFQDTSVVEQPALLAEEGVFRVQLDGYVYKETGEIDSEKTEDTVKDATGITAVYGVCYEYIKNDDETYSVFKDGQWLIMAYEEDHEFNIKKVEEEQMIKDAMSGKTSEIDAEGNPKGEIVAIEIDPETGEITQLDPNDIPELREQLQSQEEYKEE